MEKLLMMLVFGLWPWFSPPLEVIRAVSETVYPGRQESPVYTRYDILVVTGKSSGKITLDRLYVKQQSCSVKLLSWPGKKEVSEYSKGDTLLVRSTSFETGKTGTEKIHAPLTALLRQYEVVLSYKLRRKRKYIPVKNIVKNPDNINL